MKRGLTLVFTASVLKVKQQTLDTKVFSLLSDEMYNENKFQNFLCKKLKIVSSCICPDYQNQQDISESIIGLLSVHSIKVLLHKN